MNNKLFKTAVVLVTIVGMLCSFASAATINSLNYDVAEQKISMNVEFAEDATRGAYIAYAAKKVDAETEGAEEIDGNYYVLGNIIAIFQPEGDFLTLGNHGEPINPALIPEGYDYIVLKAGDNGAASTLADAFAAEIPEPVTKYTITFVNYDGTTLYEVEVEAGETPEYVGDAPVKAADAQYTYTFAGWGEIAPATENATYTATFDATVNKYTITYVVDGVETTEEVEYGATPAPEAPVKEGFTFTGWTPEIVAVTGEATYTAVFEENAAEYEYEVATQDAKYYTNDPALIEGVDTSVVNTKVVRITGLNPAEVSVTVDGVTAKYYDRRDSEGADTGVDVIIAAIPASGDENKIVITEGTTALIAFGDATGDGDYKSADVTEFRRQAAGYERTVPNYKKYLFSSDLMALLVLDVNADGSVGGADVTELRRAAAGYTRTVPSLKVYSIETMKCYTK